jgi:CheY-like chemotaxis protein
LAQPRHNPTGRPRRIVIVEDGQDIRETLTEMLQDDGHLVRSAVDGLTGLQLIVSLHPDVAFIDVGLPKLDGYQLARQLRKVAPAWPLRLVAVTGQSGAAARARALAAGFDAHLSKPFNFTELAAHL